MTTSNSPNYVYFWRPQDKNGVLSQWYQCTFVKDNIEFNCAEQFMMWNKAMLFEDEYHAKAILAANNPRTMLKLGRKVKGFNEKVWRRHRCNIVYEGNKRKFEQNPELLKQLMSKPNPMFVEASPYDRIWGIGFAKKKALANKTAWGKNLLGKTLTLLYHEFLNAQIS